MGARRPAFALILVLLLVASVFAMTVHSAVVMRASLVETSAVAAQHEDQRAAQSAASIVLRSIALGNGARPAGAGEDASGGPSGGGGADEEDLDLPPIVRQLLAAAGEDIEEEAERELDPERGGIVDGAGTSDDQAVQQRGGSGRLTLPAGEAVVEVGDRSVTIRVHDASGGLNINRADEAVLKRYFELKGLRGTALSRVVDQILDWRDEDSVPRRFGMEREGYRRIGVVARDGEIRALEELRTLQAIDGALFDSIWDDLCLGGDGKVHLPSASAAVLEAVAGLTATELEAVRDARRTAGFNTEIFEGVLESLGDAEGRLRVYSSPVVRIVATVRSATGTERVFEGTAVLSGAEITSFGMHLKPRLDAPQRYDGPR